MTDMRDLRTLAQLGTKIPDRDTVASLNGGNPDWTWDICAANPAVNHSSVAVLTSPILPYLATVAWDNGPEGDFLTLGFGEFQDISIGPEPTEYIHRVLQDFNGRIRIRNQLEGKTLVHAFDNLKPIEVHLPLSNAGELHVQTQLSFRCEYSVQQFDGDMYQFLLPSNTIAEPNDTMWCSFNVSLLQSTTGCVLGSTNPFDVVDAEPPPLVRMTDDKRRSMQKKKAARRAAKRKLRRR